MEKILITVLKANYIMKLFSALAQSLTPVLQSSFREVFTTVVIPGFERATHNLYANLASTFTKVYFHCENFIAYKRCILIQFAFLR